MTLRREPLDDDMRRLQDGDRDAVSRVFLALWPVVSGYCERLLDNHADAEDAAQAALEKVFGQIDRYDPDRPAIAWVLAVAGWECRTVRQRSVRRRDAPLEHAADMQAGDASPEDLVARAGEIAALRQVLASLDEGDRHTIELAFTDVLDEGCHGATFRKRKQRALERLRAAFRRLTV